MQTGIHVGTIVDKESADYLAENIVKIAEAKADQETIRKALDVFARTVTPSNISLNNISLIGDRKIIIDGAEVKGEA